MPRRVRSVLTVQVARLDAMFRAAIAAVDPDALVARAAAMIDHEGPVTVLAFGKAAAKMAWGAHRAFGARITGVAVMTAPAPLPDRVAGLVGGHPIPDERSVRAGRRLLDAAAAAGPDALVLCLLSGGGSALAELPAAGLEIGDVAHVTRLLLTSGAAIDEINVVRRAMSYLKGGGLAAAAEPSRLVTLAISDVGSADPATIASGPTLPPPRGRRAIDVLDGYDLLRALPARVVAALQPRRRLAAESEFVVLADGRTAGEAAARRGRELGLAASVASRELSGESRSEARRVLAAGADPGGVTVHVGETTVTVVGSGHGGRNHEAALAAAITLDGRRGAFLAAGTDGIDGTARGAGAVVDGTTAEVGRALGFDPDRHLGANDSGGFFDVVPGRIVTGPTGTNVADLWLVAAGSPAPS